MPGTKGPLIKTDGSAKSRNIYVRGVVFDGCDSPMSLSGVDGLVVREIGFRQCTGTGLRIADVENFRIDGMMALECSPAKMEQVVDVAADCAKGMIRNLDGSGVKAVNGSGDGVILEAVSEAQCR